MKNKLWIFILILAIIGIAIFFYFNSNKKTSINYETTKISTDSSTKNGADNSISGENSTNNSNKTNQNAPSTQSEPSAPSTATTPPPAEEQLATFSTKIYNTESARQNNINITCSKLNDTIVNAGSTFSFCNTVGQATTTQGYKKADIFDKYGNVKKGLGGGNCQVSTTLYNAVLNTPGLEVVERHAHTNYVPYIEAGKDAAVAYGSNDFKFKNNNNYNLKIKAESSNGNVNVTIFKLN